MQLSRAAASCIPRQAVSHLLQSVVHAGDCAHLHPSDLQTHPALLTAARGQILELQSCWQLKGWGRPQVRACTKRAVVHSTATKQDWHWQDDAPVPCRYVRADAHSAQRYALTLTGVPAEMPQARGNSSVACTARSKIQDLCRIKAPGRAWMSTLLIRAASA